MTQANQGSAMPGNGLDGSSPDGNFISRFLGWCEDSPERTALSAMEGHHEVRLSYRQLAAEAAFWQQYWQKQGFSRGDRKGASLGGPLRIKAHKQLRKAVS